MKSKPKNLWNRLVSEADPTASALSDECVARIVSQLRWQPIIHAHAPTWDEALWPLISRFALPAAGALLILVALLPAHQTPRADTLDDLITAAIEQP